jgi:hypothetical protein
MGDNRYTLRRHQPYRTRRPKRPPGTKLGPVGQKPRSSPNALSQSNVVDQLYLDSVQLATLFQSLGISGSNLPELPAEDISQIRRYNDRVALALRQRQAFPSPDLGLGSTVCEAVNLLCFSLLLLDHQSRADRDTEDLRSRLLIADSQLDSANLRMSSLATTLKARNEKSRCLKGRIKQLENDLSNGDVQRKQLLLQLAEARLQRDDSAQHAHQMDSLRAELKTKGSENDALRSVVSELSLELERMRTEMSQLSDQRNQLCGLVHVQSLALGAAVARPTTESKETQTETSAASNDAAQNDARARVEQCAAQELEVAGDGAVVARELLGLVRFMNRMIASTDIQGWLVPGFTDEAKMDVMLKTHRIDDFIRQAGLDSEELANFPQLSPELVDKPALMEHSLLANEVLRRLCASLQEHADTLAAELRQLRMDAVRGSGFIESPTDCLNERLARERQRRREWKRQVAQMRQVFDAQQTRYAKSRARAGQLAKLNEQQRKKIEYLEAQSVSRQTLLGSEKQARMNDQKEAEESIANLAKAKSQLQEKVSKPNPSMKFCRVNEMRSRRG